MKVFALVLIFAYVAVAFASRHSSRSSSSSSSPPDAELYVGQLRDSVDGPIIHVGSEPTLQMNLGSDSDNMPVPYGPPSCKLGASIGNPICFAKCITRGHKGGYCQGKVCTCVG